MKVKIRDHIYIEEIKSCLLIQAFLIFELLKSFFSIRFVLLTNAS